VLHPKTILRPSSAASSSACSTRSARGSGVADHDETDPSEATWRIKSIACKKGVTSVTVDSTRMLMAYGFLARVFEIFGRYRIVVTW